MTIAEGIAVLFAGMAAGTINTVVGSGTLVTFPVLLAVGFPPVTANVSNSLGLVPGSAFGALGYREELTGQRDRATRLVVMSVLGALAGAVLLLALPASAFKKIVPAFIAVALVLVIFQPRLAAALAARRHPGHDAERSLGLRAAVFATGVYGGYFGAAQGIILLAVMGLVLPDDLHRINALKNVLAGTANLVAGLVFIVLADPAWDAVALIAVGAAVGGVLGGRYGRRLPPAALRALIVIVGIAAIIQLVF